MPVKEIKNSACLLPKTLNKMIHRPWFANRRGFFNLIQVVIRSIQKLNTHLVLKVFQESIKIGMHKPLDLWMTQLKILGPGCCIIRRDVMTSWLKNYLNEPTRTWNEHGNFNLKNHKSLWMKVSFAKVKAHTDSLIYSEYDYLKRNDATEYLNSENET